MSGDVDLIVCIITCFQAARGGHEEIVTILVNHGVGINERTDYGKGQSVLNLAKDHHDEESDFIKFLIETMGALDLAAEDDQDL